MRVISRVSDALASLELPARTVGYSSPRPLTASAKAYSLKNPKDRAELADRPFSEWQNEAWFYYDAIGEVKFAFNLLADVMSRIRLFAAVVVDPDAPPASTTMLKRRAADQGPDERLQDTRQELTAPKSITKEVMDYMEQLVAALGTGLGGIPELNRSFTLNNRVAGECYLINYKNQWSIRSTDEVYIRKTDGKPMLKSMRKSNSSQLVGGSQTEIELPENTWIGRIWRPHPRYSSEPDSSMIALREPCDELLILQRQIRVTGRTKMNSGLLYIPDDITIAGQSVTESVTEAEQEPNSFEDELMSAVTDSIADESNVYTVAPIIARGPRSESGKSGIEYYSFSRDADKALVERSDRVLDRILQGIDLPKDIVAGLSQVRYSNAVKIDESLFKSHVEPVALMEIDALTSVYFLPAIKAKFPQIPDEDLIRLTVWYDPIEILAKPDPAAAADAGHDRYVISGATWRRSHGFSDTDAPSEAEIARRLAIEKLTIPQEQASSLLRFLMPEVFKQIQATNIEGLQPPYPQTAADMLMTGETPTPGEPGRPTEPSSSTAGESPQGGEMPPSGGNSEVERVAASLEPVDRNTGGSNGDHSGRRDR